MMIFVFMLFIIPSNLFASDYISTGNDLYLNLKLIDTNYADHSLITLTTGYLSGFMDGLVLTQLRIYEKIAPSNKFSLAELEELAKRINFRFIDIPQGGLTIGEVITIFKDYAERYPQRLSEPVRILLMDSLVDKYGYK
jgi:hypothetical protein